MKSDFDVISRQVAIDAVKAYFTDCQIEDADWHGNGIEYELESLPSVDAVPIKHGHYVGEADGYANGELVYDVWKCSECGCVFEDEYEKPTYNYCPNCGADMRGEQDGNT